MDINQQLETAIKATLAAGTYVEAAALIQARAAMQNAANLEKVLAVFAGAGEAMKQAAGQLDPAALTEMMKRGME